MDVSVVIPTYRRPEKLSSCLAALASQTLDPRRYEVLVGLDGPDPDAQRAARRAWGTCPAEMTVTPCERRGYNAVRNTLLGQARGAYLVSLNDDVVPASDLLETHAREQARAEDHLGPSIISGHSPWRAWPDETVFDRVVSETSLIFFFDQMNAPRVEALGPWHDWGFRHCYGLNFSARTDLLRQAGGFTDFHRAYGYDDIEIAFRLSRRHRTRILYRPRAVAEHDHRYGVDETFAREFRLGHSAWQYAARDPEFGEAVFGRDIRTTGEIAYSREFLHRERGLASSALKSIRSIGVMPVERLGGSDLPALVRMAYLHLLPAKRWMWRAGLLAAAEDRPADEAVFPEIL